MKNPGAKRILLVDDHAVFREGLAKILEPETDLDVCGEAENASAALLRAEELRPDMAIVDISLEGISGIVLTKDLRSRFPDLRILILSMHKESLYAERALAAGAHGYIMKHESGQKLAEAIRRVLSGQTFVSEQLNQKLLNGLFRSPGENKPSSLVDRLGVREFEVFRLIGKGYGTRQIADELEISIKTVEAHRIHIREKLNLSNTFELVQYAREWSLS